MTERGTVMAGPSKEQLIQECIKWYPVAEQLEWSRWYRGWTRSALERQAKLMAEHHASIEREIVVIGWDGRSRPILRYRDELGVPDHMRSTVKPPTSAATTPCTCACNSGGFCGGCGHAGCGRR